MENPRPEKVAVVDEVRSRLATHRGAILTEYRGLTVAELAELRQALEKAGGDYKVYKNTLVKLATSGRAARSAPVASRGSDRDRFRDRRDLGRGKGASRLREDEPAPDREGRHVRRQTSCPRPS